MTVYKCLRCNCIHGWSDHPRVTKITRHVRYPGEDVWYCPTCNQEHRTTDGTILGQLHKRWEVVDLDRLDDARHYLDEFVYLKYE